MDGQNLKVVESPFLPGAFSDRVARQTAVLENSSFHPSIFRLPPSDIQGNSTYA